MNPIGVMLNNLERDRLKAFAVAARLGWRVVHTSALPEAWLTGPQRSEYLDAARASGLDIATMFVGFDSQSYASPATIATTVGLTIPHLRPRRIQAALRHAELAHELGVPTLAMHVGFFPHECSHPEYRAVVQALQQIADHCATLGQTLHLETGQEAAAVLLQLLRDLNRPNVGVNFDVGNFVLYGSDEPLNALDCLAPFVRGVHCKDGFRPTSLDVLGQEVPLGQGEVPFPDLIARLVALGYQGPLIIEREHGPNVAADMEAGRKYLTGLLERTNR